MIVKNLIECTDFESIRTIWNEQTDNRFYITSKLFNASLLSDQSVNKKLSKVVYDKDELIAFLLLKTYDNIAIKEYYGYAWISLCFTKIEHRNKGIMSSLISSTEKKLRALGYQTLLLGKDMNPFLCGSPHPFNTTSFFLKRGFTQEGISYDLIRYVDSKTTSPLRRNTTYDIRISTANDFPKMRQFFAKNFPSRWSYEFNEYVTLNGDGSEYVIIEKEHQVVAFARVSNSNKQWIKYSINFPDEFNNLWGVGPLGVDPDFRGYGLGYDVTLYAINYAIQNGAKEIIIDWTSKVSFYQKFDFDVWMTYDSLRKILKG